MMYFFKHILVLLLLSLLSFNVSAQDKKAKLLEKLYEQGYYQKVLRKSNKLIESKGYKGDAFIHMYQVAALHQLKSDPKYMEAHQYHDEQLEAAINGWKKTEDFNKSLKSNEAIANSLQELISIEEVEVVEVKKTKKVVKNKPPKEKIKTTDKVIVKDNYVDTLNLPLEDKIISCAEGFIGVPYRYGGRDSTGFDCSGYTGYIMEQFGYTLPRSARDQEAHVEKIPIEEAKKGDLVFFSHRRNIIAHVGLVISEPGEELTMIHASSSRGIMISNIVQSTYWKPRLRSAGRVIKTTEGDKVE